MNLQSTPSHLKSRSRDIFKHGYLESTIGDTRNQQSELSGINKSGITGTSNEGCPKSTIKDIWNRQLELFRIKCQGYLESTIRDIWNQQIGRPGISNQGYLESTISDIWNQ